MVSFNRPLLPALGVRISHAFQKYINGRVKHDLGIISPERALFSLLKWFQVGLAFTNVSHTFSMGCWWSEPAFPAPWQSLRLLPCPGTPAGSQCQGWLRAVQSWGHSDPKGRPGSSRCWSRHCHNKPAEDLGKVFCLPSHPLPLPDVRLQRGKRSGNGVISRTMG